ncbi:MAG: GxxExxY protein [Myxococcales bacterium]|nr:GxxExxY protein [Myxococcales bacterium]
MQQRQEPSVVVDQLAHAVIGAAIEVHRELGPGFHERIYQDALALELEARAIPFAREVPVPLRYKGQPLTTAFRLDLVVGNLIIVELKRSSSFRRPTCTKHSRTWRQLVIRWDC